MCILDRNCPSRRRGSFCINISQYTILIQTLLPSYSFHSKLEDWSSADEEDPLAPNPQAPPAGNSRYARVVVLKHAFTLAELEADPGAAIELKEDIRDEAESIGTVTNVTLYDVSGQETPGGGLDLAGLSGQLTERGRGHHHNQVPGCHLGTSVYPCEYNATDHVQIALSLFDIWNQKMNGRFFGGQQVSLSSPIRPHFDIARTRMSS